LLRRTKQALDLADQPIELDRLDVVIVAAGRDGLFAIAAAMSGFVRFGPRSDIADWPSIRLCARGWWISVLFSEQANRFTCASRKVA